MLICGARRCALRVGVGLGQVVGPACCRRRLDDTVYCLPDREERQTAHQMSKHKKGAA
jgi:hypothetical protein